MTETIEVLKAARELISDPAHWTRQVYARDDKGNAVEFDSAKAICFCSAGAIWKSSGKRPDAGQAALDALKKTFGDEDIYSFNDGATHPEVLSLFDAAIARLA